MRNFTIYLAILLCLMASKMLGQETFEKQAKRIALKIENITKEQKEALKVEVEEVNIQLEKGSISQEQADLKKQQLAQARATIIENKVAVAQEELKDLVQAQVEGKISNTASDGDQSGGTMIIIGGSTDSIGKNKTEINVTSMKVYKGQSEKEDRQSKRTTTQVVLATGLNNVVIEGTAAKSDFRYWGSHFYEWGLTYNTRIFKNNNLLHAKYGLSVMYNNLRATDNRYFVVDGNQTNLEVDPVHQEDSRFKNVNLVFPLHLEFDFTKPSVRDGKTYFKTHDSFRLGLGGYVGTNLKSKQYIKYDIDEYKSREITKGGFNVDSFIYGLSGYVGYGATSLYLKYDLNPMFKSNTIKQNNVSLGVRFDFN
ncbi:hypothetical protein SAMN05443667_101342 [Flavobacterium gillisiae]|uniref:Outer membrane protein beta-barrel domain-containing protein n=1 Tax=Flavobacterium gillisiae TaxID=150146 RepID=A0A1H3X223_9FLAO|nr:hypothetical protein [Flavobacterium gillisiae]SDZ93293.1 hypothetical protein SAMN05443667_101342 [Flavobacterium gillisiae]